MFFYKKPVYKKPGLKVKKLKGYTFFLYKQLEIGLSPKSCLIFSGNNTDICPANDLGLKKGIKIIYKLKDLPSDEEVYKIAEKWRPYRSIASRYIWEVVDQKINLT